MNYPRRNTCQRAALVWARVSLSSAMMLPGWSLSRAAGVRTTPARSQPATSSSVGMGAGGTATSIWHAVHGEVNSVTCFDPVPNPGQAGWTQEGSGSIQVATPLGLTDPNPALGAGLQFFCSDSTIFTGDVVLTPRLTPGQTGQMPFGDGNTGIHVTISDGVKMVRAYVLTSGGLLRVALALAGGGYSIGFPFPGSSIDFTLRRNSDGSGTLSVANPTVFDRLVLSRLHLPGP